MNLKTVEIPIPYRERTYSSTNILSVETWLAAVTRGNLRRQAEQVRVILEDVCANMLTESNSGRLVSGGIGQGLRRALSLSHTRNLFLDDPRTTEVRRDLILENRFLREIYFEWYQMLASALPQGAEPVLELGSGAGFMKLAVPQLITSEIFYVRGTQVVLDGQALPFQSGELRGIVMTDVLHHLRDVRKFLDEAVRVLRPGGVISMVEPWVTPWSKLIYGAFHHEPFTPTMVDWRLPPGGPLSCANGALPWVVFARDRVTFELEFPALQIVSITPCMPFRYAVSGGVSLHTLMPGWSYGAWRAVERLLEPAARHLGMFAHITMVRSQDADARADL